MSTVKGLRAGVVVGILAGMALLTGAVRANAQDQFSTERPGSILIFPKVINTGEPGPETVIQIANTSNIPVFAHCFYVDGRFVNGAPVWQITDFDITLTRQQPTHWAVSLGRAVDPLDSEQGLDPGLIPPVSPGFTGFLTCVEVDQSEAPMGGNALKGEATIGNIEGAGTGLVNNVSKYNAIAIPAVDAGPNSDNILCLGSKGMGSDCPVAEYAACPRDLLMNFQAEGGPDPALAGAGDMSSIVSSSLTMVPCGMDFENLVPGSTTLVAEPVRNEFEENLSVSSAIPVDCWFSDFLGASVFGAPASPFTIGDLGTQFGTSVLTPISPNQLPALGVLNVLRTADDGSSDTAASNLFWGPNAVCSTTTTTSCTKSSDCPTNETCVPVTVPSEIRLPSP